MARTLIVYESKYGSTEAAVKKMSLVLGPGRYCRPSEFKPEYKDTYDFFVIGGPVYNEMVDSRIRDFAAANRDWLAEKKTATFVVCLSRGEQGTHYLQSLNDALNLPLIHTGVISGKLNMNKLDAPDTEIIVKSYGTIGQPAIDRDYTSIPQVIEFAMSVKAEADKMRHALTATEVRNQVEAFLSAYDACVLSTGSGTNVRATPVTYKYRNGHIYVLTEGGVKFANLLLNNRVSVCVVDGSYSGKNRRSGLQLEGEAAILDSPADPAYRGAMETMGLKYERMTTLPWRENILDIKLHKAIFRWREFDGTFGVDRLQTCEF